MSFSALTVDPGEVPSAPIAVRLRGGVNFQGVVPIQGDQATDEYDSALVTLPGASGVLVAGRVYVGNLFLHNQSAQVRFVTVENAAQAAPKLFDQRPMQPGEIINLERGGAEMVGIRWHVDVAGEVVGQIKGWQ